MPYDLNAVPTGYQGNDPSQMQGAPQSPLNQAAPGQQNLPPYLQQQQNAFTPAAGINNIIRAIMAGRMQANKAGGQAQGSPVGMQTQPPPAMAPPNPIAPLAGGAVPYTGSGPWGVGPTQADNSVIGMMTPPPVPQDILGPGPY